MRDGLAAWTFRYSRATRRRITYGAIPGAVGLVLLMTICILRGDFTASVTSAHTNGHEIRGRVGDVIASHGRTSAGNDCVDTKLEDSTRTTVASLDVLRIPMEKGFQDRWVQPVQDAPRIPAARREIPATAEGRRPMPVPDTDTGTGTDIDGLDRETCAIASRLQAIFGTTETEVGAGLVSVPFLGMEVQINRRQGAAMALYRVGKRLEPMLEQKPSLARHLHTPVVGSVPPHAENSSSMAAHGLGIAVDLACVDDAAGQAGAPEDGSRPGSRMPEEILEAFAAEGFVVGEEESPRGFVHFEFRPAVAAREVLKAAK
jgi:hypothetical protein